MEYCITTGEVQWVIGECLDQCKVPVADKKGENGKENNQLFQQQIPTKHHSALIQQKVQRK
jgi:hypothetical protein